MRRSARSVVGLFLVCVLSGCASAGVFPSLHLTTVELAESNFSVIATNVTGQATAGYILGVSVGGGTVAVARVKGDGQLFAEAVQNLWENFEQENGPVAGRSLALVNVRFDSDALNLIVYTRPTVWVRADVVEFGS